MLKKYLKELLYVAQQGDAREESYCSALYTMFQTYADEHPSVPKFSWTQKEFKLNSKEEAEK